jgi:hypothetical protein
MYSFANVGVGDGGVAGSSKACGFLLGTEAFHGATIPTQQSVSDRTAKALTTSLLLDLCLEITRSSLARDFFFDIGPLLFVFAR